MSTQFRRDVGTPKQMIGTGSIIIHARPRAGKGTQCRILVSTVGGATTSSGDLARAADLPPEVAAIRDAGGLIPTEDFFRYVLPSVGGPEYAGKMLWLDAVGRKHGEEADTLRVMEERGHPVLAVVYIEVSEEETRRRGQEGDARGRVDDTPEKHEHRLAVFCEDTLPVIDYYQQQGVLVRVNGEQSTTDVTRDIIYGLLEHLS